MLKRSMFLMLALLVQIGLWAQQKNVTGVVTDNSNDPIPGVSILIKGTTNGTITDIDGKYSLTVPGDNAVLVYSFIGMKSQEITVGTQSTINVSLISDTEEIDEVVVVGYGVQKKKLNTGATIQMKGEEISKLNTTNPLQAMQGQTPGVQISSTSGQPGSDMKVTIRGLGTVGKAGPLYLIDGIGGDISTLNPADIESIDVLKDAASAAIYGAQAANGVVLITTKSGKEGKAQVTFDAYYGVQNVARKADMLNAEEYKTIMDEQALNSGSKAYDWDSYKSIYKTVTNADGTVTKTPIDTDWVDAMFKDNAKTQNYALSISGGSSTSNYVMSMGYMSQEGIVGGKDVSNYERYNFRVNSEHKLYGNLLKVGEHVSFIYKKNKGISVGNQYSNTLRGAFSTSPLSPIYSDNGYTDADGNKSIYNDTSDSDWYNADGNPYGAMMVNTNNMNDAQTFAADTYAELQPIKNLKIRSVFGINYNASDYRSYTPFYQFSKYSYNTAHTSVSQNMNKGYTLTWTNTASYDWKIADHAFNALIGSETSRYDGTYVGSGNWNLKTMYNDWQHAYVDNTEGTDAAGKTTEGKPHDAARTMSYFARLGWNLNETYMFNATLRADGSSKFSDGNRFGYFPSVSAGWVVSNESFLENTKGWIDFLKIRASWGQVGNQNINNYQYLAPVTTSNINYVFGNTLGATSNIWGAYPSRLANSDITWETSEQTNIGIDARFLNKLSLTADFYTKKTKDWLVEAPVLATAGASAPYINGGDVTNTGVELALNWSDKIGEVSYSIGGNIAYNKNEVGKIPTQDGIIHGTTNMLYDNSPEFYRAQNGHPIGYFWGYETSGIFQSQEEIINWNADGKHGFKNTNTQPGDVKYVDQDKNGIINEADKVDLGNGMPDYTYGINLSAEYKGFDFSVNATGVIGNQIVQSYRNHSNKQANYTSAILDRWTGYGTSNKTPRVTESNINWDFSDLYLQDGDFLRIKTITLGYDLSKLIKNKYISQARIYAQAQNLITFTKYDGMDPEIGYGTSDWVSGVDLGYYPSPKTFLVGVNLKF